MGVAPLALTASQRKWGLDQSTAGASRAPAALLLILVLLATGIIAAGYLSFRTYQAQYRLEVGRRLDSISALKVSELEQYRLEHLADASLVVGNPVFPALVARVLGNSANGHAEARLRAWLGKVQAHNLYDFHRVFLLDAQGALRMSVPESAEPVPSVVSRRAAEVLRSGEVAFQDFYRNEHDQRIYLTVLAPVIGGRDGGRALGVLALCIDPEAYIYPFISRWPTPSETAETLLVRREGNDALYLNRLRFQQDTALSLRISSENPEVPSIQAILGREGIVEGQDYRGVPVIASVRTVPGSPWALVARMDLSEAYAPLRERMWMTVTLVGALLLGAVATVGGLWRQQRAFHYREKFRAERDRSWLQDVIARSLNEIYVFDPETLRFSFVNAGACRNIGYAAEELAALTPLDLKPKFTEETFHDLIQPLRTGASEVLVFETVHRRKDRSEYPVEIHLQLVGSGAGKFFLAIINDITERKRVETALRRQRDLYDMLAQTNQEVGRCTGQDEMFAALCRVAVEHGRFLFAWVGLVDTEQDRVLPVAQYGEDAGYMNALRISASAASAAGRGPTGRTTQTGRHTVSNRFLEDPGTAPWHAAAQRAGIRASAAFPLRERGTVIGAISLYADETDFFTTDVLATLDEMSSDVSFALDSFALAADRARAVADLRESEDRYRDLVENSHDLICTHDMEGALLSANEAMVKTTGYSRDALLQMNMADFVDATVRERFVAYLNELRDRGRACGTVRVRTATGEHRFWKFDNTLRAQDADVPIVRGIAHDITDRMTAERQRRVLESQLRAAQKIEALGTLAGGIAHDFNNILGTIIGNVALARQDVGPGHAATESLEEIAQASRRARDLVRRILTFGSQQQQPQDVVSLRPVVEEAVALLRATIPAGIEITTAFDPDAPNVLADRTQVQQVLINLCTNAWQAMEGKIGRISIRLDAATLDDETVAAHADLLPGRFARICVTDSGSGMDAATLERMFEPFFTTKPVGQGTGLGLSVVHGVVRAHHGAITTTSQPGVGTTFCVHFPAVETSAPGTAADNAAGAPSASTASGQHVLYLDDEPALVLLVTRMLERLGYRVSGYTQAEEAMAAVRADPGQFDLVVTDLNMPGLSGLQVARELSSLRPDLPVVIASGYVTEGVRVEASEAGVREVIYKPDTVGELCAVVQRLAGAAKAT